MAVIPIPFPIHAVGNRAPRWPFALNRNSPQAQGIVNAWPLFGHRHGLVNNSPGTVTGTVTFRAQAAANQLAADFPAVSGDRIEYAGQGNITTLPFFWSFWTQIDAVTSDAVQIYKGAFNVAGHYVQWLQSTIVSLSTNQSGARQQTASVVNTFPVGTVHHIVVGCRPSGLGVVYKNGVEVSYAAQVTHTAPASGSDALTFGTYLASPTAFEIDGRMWGVMLSRADPSPAMARSLYNPATRWDLYEEVGAKIFFFPSSATSTATEAEDTLRTLSMMGFGR
jgi:hypothetical protein